MRHDFRLGMDVQARTDVEWHGRNGALWIGNAGKARPVKASRGIDWQARLGSSGHGVARKCKAGAERRCRVYCGLDRQGVAGEDWQCAAWSVLARNGRAGAER